MSFKTSDEMRRQKELDEARKAGLAPAELDEEGKEINPHIPQYMTTAPWYLNSDKPTLKHQRNWKQQMEDSKRWYDRGVKVFQATKYRKGACENCGSMTHKSADCLERPRARGAKFTGKHIAADDKIDEISLTTYDSKRDRYNGYDIEEYAKVVDRYEAVDAVRQELKLKEQVEALYAQGKLDEARAKAAAAAAGDGGGGGEGGEGAADEAAAGDDAKIADDEDAAFGEVKKRVRTTAGGSTGSVRNLRIREDTAKYLLNLDTNSAHYDPKSRSMREDPNPNKPANEKTFFGDNFVRTSGEYATWQALNLHSMTAAEKGGTVHVQALPSLAETMYTQFKQKKESLTRQNKDEVLAKYGNEAAPAPDPTLLLGQSEAYVEYDRAGRLIRGNEPVKRSRYDEDVLINNHTSVWGSWWSDGTWGYACCHSAVKNSYCTGKAGEKAAAQSEEAMAANLAAKAERAAAEAEARAKSTLSNAHLEGGGVHGSVWGSEGAADAELDDEKVQAALKKLERQEREAEELKGDERKRKFNSLADGDDQDITPEEMEAYRLKKSRGGEDPMAAFKGSSNGTGGYDLL